MGWLRRLDGRPGLLHATRVQVALAAVAFSVALTAEDCCGATTTGMPRRLPRAQRRPPTATPLPTGIWRLDLVLLVHRDRCVDLMLHVPALRLMP